MGAHIVRGDALTLPLADNTVDLICTSPPYFALRSYTDNGQHYAGQLGSEPTPAAYVDALIAATAEMVRVLKPAGSIWLNLGDKYVNKSIPGNRDTLPQGGRTGQLPSPGHRSAKQVRRIQAPTGGMPEKSLMGIPWRYALRCIDQLGLILRAEIIWAKPNGLPESVTDRVRRSHEQWFHFTKEPRYYSAVDEIRGDLGRSASPSERVKASGSGLMPDGPENRWLGTHSASTGPNPLGKLPGSVWTVPDDVSPIRDILTAVAAGALTPGEGERLWTGLSDSSRMWISPETAGSGPDIAIPEGTERPARATTQRTGRTASPTSCSSDPSPLVSPSTTSAATSHVSDPSTSNQSLDVRTSDELTPSEHTAHADIPWLTPTLRSRLLDIPTSGVESAPARNSDDSGSSVWNVPTQPLKVPTDLGIDHFAAFPFEWPRRIIRGWSPPGICTVCGEGRRPVASVDYLRTQHDRPGTRIERNLDNNRNDAAQPFGSSAHRLTTITGYACACPTPGAPTRPAIILDPFGGTGTTALVADALGRTGISLDMSADYNRIARWRTTDPAQIAAAMQVDKPAPVMAGQGDLFGGDAA